MVFVLLRSLTGGERPADAPHTVMVLVLNRTSHSTDYINKIVENRQEYAKAHGRVHSRCAVLLFCPQRQELMRRELEAETKFK
jgi:hypothetical protein